MTRVVYEGMTKLGHRTIHEGDIVEFNVGNSYYKGAAYYSCEFTPRNKEMGYISTHLNDFRYSTDDCHSFKVIELVTHIVCSVRERRKSGFARFILSIEKDYH